MSTNDASSNTSVAPKFDPQTYLLSYFDEISYLVELLNYDYVIPLITTEDYSYPATISVLTDKVNKNKFTQLKTYQYNGLSPRVRLFRVEYDEKNSVISQKEYIFHKDYKYTPLSDLTGGIKRNNSGLKSFTWKLAGSNPVTAEKQIIVDIEFFFDSINSFSGGSYDKMIEAWKQAGNTYDKDLFSFCDKDDAAGGGTTTNYWSLIFHPQQKNNRDGYSTYNFRIKAIVGWEKLDPTIKEHLKLTDASDDIDKLNYCFFLNLVKHEFSLNEDGSITLKTSYVASFENSTFNYQFDVLGDLKQQIENLKNNNNSVQLNAGSSDSIYGLLSNLPYAKELGLQGLGGTGQRYTEQKVGDALEDMGYNEDRPLGGFFGTEQTLGTKITDSNYNDIVKISKLLNELKNNDEDVQQECLRQLQIGPENSLFAALTEKKLFQATQENYQKILDVKKDEFQKKRNLLKQEFYSKFINNLLDFSKNEGKFFKVILTGKDISKWENWIANTSNGDTYDKPSFASQEQLSDDDVKTTAFNNLLRKAQFGVEPTEDNFKEIRDNLFKKAKERTPDDGMSIVFTTFGHILDSAYKTVSENANVPIDELKKNKLILGNLLSEISILDINTKTNKNIKNLAFLPIDLTLLQAFLVDKIVKPQKDTYPLFSFIRDALATLATSALNVKNAYNDSVSSYTNVSLASTIITLGDNGENVDPLITKCTINGESSIYSNKSLWLTSQVDKSSILTPYYVNFLTIDKHKNFYNYFVIYDKNTTDFKPTIPLNLEQDESQGIYHYTYGQDYGLVKAINFSRIDQPYLKESKAVGQETFYLGQFRDRYNADITMVGNNIYYPGMLLYITPSVEGVLGEPNFSQISGIGGYYIVIEVESKISEEGYETKLKTIWQFDGTETSNKSDITKKCKALLEEIGLSSESGALTSNVVLDVISKIADVSVVNSGESLCGKPVVETVVEVLSSNEVAESTVIGAVVGVVSSVPSFGPLATAAAGVVFVKNEYFNDEEE